jgi:hypothetical protein
MTPESVLTFVLPSCLQTFLYPGGYSANVFMPSPGPSSPLLLKSALSAWVDFVHYRLLSCFLNPVLLRARMLWVIMALAAKICEPELTTEEAVEIAILGISPGLARLHCGSICWLGITSRRLSQAMQCSSRTANDFCAESRRA